MTFDDDVAAAIDQLRRDRGLGVSAAVNELARRGLAATPTRRAFSQRTSPGDARIDVSDVAEALDLLDGPARP